MLISLIAAIGSNMVIGDKGKIPWHLPADFEYFKKQTLDKPIIMGAKTFESIGKALPQRQNIVLSSDLNYQASGCLVAHSLEEALDMAKPASEAMICGGASVYKQFLPLADRLYLTFVHHDFEGDAFFPTVDFTQWQEVERVNNQPNERNPFAYSFVIFEKITT